MTNPIQLFRFLFQPRAKMLYCPILPDYLKLDDGSTDLDWIIKYKRNAFCKWHYYADVMGCPIQLYRQQAEKMVEYIKENKIEL